MDVYEHLFPCYPPIGANALVYLSINDSTTFLCCSTVYHVSYSLMNCEREIQVMYIPVRSCSTVAVEILNLLSNSPASSSTLASSACRREGGEGEKRGRGRGRRGRGRGREEGAKFLESLSQCPMRHGHTRDKCFPIIFS